MKITNKFSNILNKIREIELISITNIINNCISIEIGRNCEIQTMNGPKIIGEFSFKIYCPWRLIEKSKIILSSYDEPEDLDMGLRVMSGKKIYQIKLLKNNDLLFIFESSFILEVFCDRKGYNNEDTFPDPNYQFTDLEFLFSIDGNDISVIDRENHKNLLLNNNMN